MVPTDPHAAPLPGATDDEPRSPKSRRMRIGLRGAAQVVLLPGNARRDVQMNDLSSDGLSVMASRPISPGTRCTVSFDVPSAGHASPVHVDAPAKAVYSSYTGPDGFRIGMVFTGLDAATRAAIDDFLR